MKWCRYISIVLLLFFALVAKANPLWQKRANDPALLHQAIKQVTDVMVHDIYAPPVASRIYAYVSIAAYEAAISPDYISLAGQLKGLHTLPQPPDAAYSPGLSAVHAVLTLGRALLISEGRVEVFHEKMLADFRKMSMPKAVYEQSLAYGATVAHTILEWSQQDHYKETRSFEKYGIEEEESTWKPTPPAYMRAVEPHWGRMRTFILDSSGQFRPQPATLFSKDSLSPFYRQAMEVYQAQTSLTSEQKEIAHFWDCNPFKMNIKGHVMFATKKISPGGHWINITRLACEQAGANLSLSAAAYATVAITLADAFISCWEAKYRSNTIRPETYINQYIDPNWVPLLQTPPFPEYTSGHSVISIAAAQVLTFLFGGQFAFADDTEVSFGLPIRHFSSFEQAAEEAAISRFYGGIHYMPAIVNGKEQGRQIGAWVLQKLHTRKNQEIVLKEAE